MFNCLNNIIYSFNVYEKSEEATKVLTNIYDDLSNNIEDNGKYSQEPFVVKKMIKELKEIKNRDVILKYYGAVIERNLKQSTYFNKEFQESLGKAITKINTPENSFIKTE